MDGTVLRGELCHEMKIAFSLARRHLISRLVPAVCCGIFETLPNIFGLAPVLAAIFNLTLPRILLTTILLCAT